MVAMYVLIKYHKLQHLITVYFVNDIKLINPYHDLISKTVDPDQLAFRTGILFNGNGGKLPSCVNHNKTARFSSEVFAYNPIWVCRIEGLKASGSSSVSLEF